MYVINIVIAMRLATATMNPAPIKGLIGGAGAAQNVADCRDASLPIERVQDSVRADAPAPPVAPGPQGLAVGRIEWARAKAINAASTCARSAAGKRSIDRTAPLATATRHIALSTRAELCPQFLQGKVFAAAVLGFAALKRSLLVFGQRLVFVGRRCLAYPRDAAAR
jgi:hypothetical protein